jgi:hypothetical protein
MLGRAFERFLSRERSSRMSRTGRERERAH